MIRFRDLILLILFAMLPALVWVESHAFQQGPGSQPVYVPAQHGDCINTFIVRLMVAASNAGSAFGEYEGSRFMVVRRGDSPQRCWLELGQWDQFNQLEDAKRLKCLFVNPLGG